VRDDKLEFSWIKMLEEQKRRVPALILKEEDQAEITLIKIPDTKTKKGAKKECPRPASLTRR
jgi:hypothetical protein